MGKLPAITVHQPWAQLIAAGLKQYETRSWAISYRGLIGIHAGKRWTKEEQFYKQKFMQDYPKAYDALNGGMTFGGIIAVCELTNIYKTEEVRDRISEMERAFGNYSDNRFAWQLKVKQVYTLAYPAVGKQGIWTWEW